MAGVELLEPVYFRSLDMALDLSISRETMVKILNYDFLKEEALMGFTASPDMEERVVATILARWGDYYDEESVRGAFRHMASCSIYCLGGEEGFFLALLVAINPSVDPSLLMSYSEVGVECPQAVAEVFWSFNAAASVDVLESIEIKRPVVRMITKAAGKYLKSGLENSMSESMNEEYRSKFKNAVVQSTMESGIPTIDFIGNIASGKSKMSDVAMMSKLINSKRDMKFFANLNTFAESLAPGLDVFRMFEENFELFYLATEDLNVLERFASLVAFIQRVGTRLGAGKFHHPLHNIF